MSALFMFQMIFPTHVLRSAIPSSPHPQVEWSRSSLVDHSLQIIQFTDFECSSCMKGAQALEQLQQKYPNRIQIEVINFPLSSECNRSASINLHPLSGFAARVGIAMKETGKFDEYYQLLMHRKEKLTEEVIHSAIKSLNQDFQGILNRAASPEVARELASDIETGIALGIDSTPTLIVNGRRLLAGVDIRLLESILSGKETPDTIVAQEKSDSILKDLLRDPWMLTASTTTTATDVSFLTSGWTPPIGIPHPSFGMTEQVPPSPSPWSGPAPGFYYVNGSVACSDASNGYPAQPRCTIPSNVPAGSVIELHGTYDKAHTSPQGIRLIGTASAPIYIRGVSSTNRPKIRNCIEISDSRYLILENLEFFSQASCKIQLALDGDSYLSFRNNEVHGHLNSGGMILYGKATSLSSHIVLYNNRIHDNGDWQNVQGLYDQDIHGIKVGGGMSYLWVIDNEMFHNSGDGIQISAGSWADAPALHHIYVGRNHSYDNRQTGFWTKEAYDVIFSQNKAHGARAIDASIGACMGVQYGPERVWFIYNEVYDCDNGFATGATSGPGGSGLGANMFFIGNVIHDIHRAAGLDTSNDAWKDGSAFKLTDEGSATKHIHNNTIYNVDRGIAVPRGSGALGMSGNIFAATILDDIFIDSAASSIPGKSDLRNTIFDSTARIDWGDGVKRNVPSMKTAYPSQGVGCSEVNPSFINPTVRDFHLQSNSPAIDMTTAANVYAFFQTTYGLSIAFDIEGQSRPQGAAWDIGAYEVPVTDSDGDGLPDSWEIQYFSSISDPRAEGDLDPDGDGLNNLSEFSAGTSPIDSNPRLVITNETWSGNNFVISWNSVSGKVYRVESSTTMTNWTVSGVVTSTAPVSTWTDTAVVGTKKFYRVKLP
jgi:predicted DsbA family dithiol-disulfide isomerase